MAFEAARKILAEAAVRGAGTLTEYDAKRLLAAYGIPVTRDRLVSKREDLAAGAAKIGYPVALKGHGVAHKTEAGLVHLDLRTEAEALAAFDEITAAMAGRAGGVLVAEMLPKGRELAVGMVRDADFGPCVMFGLGGVFTEVLGDVAFRRAPLTAADTSDLLRSIAGHRILEGVRGLPQADRDALGTILVAVGRIGLDHPAVREIDCNPVILAGSRPVVADALIVLED
jgi:acetyl-CoA synthetase (ADP-forming)